MRSEGDMGGGGSSEIFVDAKVLFFFRYAVKRLFLRRCNRIKSHRAVVPPGHGGRGVPLTYRALAPVGADDAVFFRCPKAAFSSLFNFLFS